jgi:hypothetical protein
MLLLPCSHRPSSCAPRRSLHAERAERAEQPCLKTQALCAVFGAVKAPSDSFRDAQCKRVPNAKPGHLVPTLSLLLPHTSIAKTSLYLHRAAPALRNICMPPNPSTGWWVSCLCCSADNAPLIATLNPPAHTPPSCHCRVARRPAPQRRRRPLPFSNDPCPPCRAAHIASAGVAGVRFAPLPEPSFFS